MPKLRPASMLRLTTGAVIMVFGALLLARDALQALQGL